MVVMVMLSPRATFLLSDAPIALFCIKDYTHAIASFFILCDTSEGMA
jgi:hypothetical protein